MELVVYDGEWITNDEDMSLLYPVEERFNLERVIPAKFNRAVIFLVIVCMVHISKITTNTKTTGDLHKYYFIDKYENEVKETKFRSR